MCLILCVVPLSMIKSLFLAGMWVIVMAFDLVNSSVERAFDLIDKNFHSELKTGIFLWVVMIVELYD